MDYLSLRRKLIEKDFGSMNDRQFEAVTTTEGALLILAGAGSGKTTVLVNRIAYLCKYGNAYSSDFIPEYSADDIKAAEDYLSGDTETLNSFAFRVFAPRPYEILAITFTNKAAGELKERIAKKIGDDADVWAGTFHSICGRILRSNAGYIGFTSHFTVYDADDQKRLMKEIIKTENIDEKLFPAKSVLNIISNAKDSLITPDEFAVSAGNDFRLKTVAKLYKEYQNRLESNDAMDFDDMINNTVRLFRENPDILSYYGGKFKYIMVDEYQDTNHAQYELVHILSSINHNICVVGDDDQSIYRFRGATIENILNFEEDFPGAKVIRLEQNYRSTGTILDAANAVIENNRGRKGKVLWTDKGTGEKINVYIAQSDRDEARFVADTVLDLKQGGDTFNSCAVLYRMNAQSNPFETVFAKSGISYKIIGGMRFYERKEIKDLISYLCVINNRNDSVRLKRIINVPKRGIGDTTVNHAQEIADTLGVSLFEVLKTADEYAALSRAAGKLKEFCELIESLSEKVGTLTLSELYKETLEKTGYTDMLLTSGEIDAPDRKANLEELGNNIYTYEQENLDATLSSFLEEIALISDIDALNSDEDKITLMTVHSAKGLEFKNVFLIGMEEGIFPGNQSIYGTPEDIEEERRLAYVAITRAKKNLYISRAQSRMLYGQTNRNLPSRFLNEIPNELYVETAAEPQFNSCFSDGSSFGSVHVYGGGTPKPTNTYKPAAPSFAAKPQVQNSDYHVGQRVNHKTFGDGMILSVASMGNDLLLEISFDNSGTKKLMASFAKLKTL